MSPAKQKRGRHWLAVAVVLTLAAAAAGCDWLPGRGQNFPKPDAPGAGGDERYGAAPAPHSDVTYQPEVVFVSGGSGSVRSVSDDAMTWRIDPNAAHAGELAKGKIMFLTGRAVGRVLDVRREGEDLAVMLGPVDITEVIRDGTFKGDQPIDLESPVPYDAGQPFWAEVDLDPASPPAPGTPVTPIAGRGPAVSPRIHLASATSVSATSASATSASATSASASLPGPASATSASAESAAKFTVMPVCCAGGVGAGFTYDSGATRIAGNVTLLMNKPRASFHLEISGTKVIRAELQIQGMIGLRVEIAGATNAGQNVNKLISVPIDFSVPIGTVLGVPFAATVNQVVGVQTAFSSKDGNLRAKGEWSLSGALGFGYANGSFGVHAPKNLQVSQSITDSIYGPSVGVSGVIVSYQAAFRVGLGALGFTAGLYFKFTMTIGLTVGSALGAPIELCRSVQLGIWARYGVGYTIPAAMVTVINEFLNLFNVAPIPKEGGIGRVDNVFNRAVIHPDVPICRA